jgi:hypothetical protein
MPESSMDIENIARRLSFFLAPFLGYLLKQKKYEGAAGNKDTHAWETAKTFWSKLGPGIRQRAALQEAFQYAAVSPHDEDVLASLRLQLKKLLSDNRSLAEELGSIWKEAMPEEERDLTVMDFGDMRWRDALDRHDDLLRRLDMIRLLRAGVPPEKIAEEFVTDTDYLYRLNAAFSLNGMHGILSPDPRNWLDRLSKDDPILRRLEMIRLIRSGTPPPVVAGEFNALTEYIQRINERFSRNGVIGILTEEDFREFRSIHPEVISICTFNLHGMHREQPAELRRIAHEMAASTPLSAPSRRSSAVGGYGKPAPR